MKVDPMRLRHRRSRTTAPGQRLKDRRVRTMHRRMLVTIDRPDHYPHVTCLGKGAVPVGGPLPEGSEQVCVSQQGDDPAMTRQWGWNI